MLNTLSIEWCIHSVSHSFIQLFKHSFSNSLSQAFIHTFVYFCTCTHTEPETCLNNKKKANLATAVSYVLSPAQTHTNITACHHLSKVWSWVCVLCYCVSTLVLYYIKLCIVIIACCLVATLLKISNKI